MSNPNENTPPPDVTPMPPPTAGEPPSPPIPTTAETLAQLDAANAKLAEVLATEITCPTCGTRVSPKES